MLQTMKHTIAAAALAAVLAAAAGIAAAAPAVLPIALLPAGTRIPLRFLTPLDSSTARQGDPVTFAVAGNVIVDHFVLVQKDAPVSGTLTRVASPGLFGRSGSMVVGYLDVPTTDGGAARLKGIVVSRGTISPPEEGAAAASLAGAVLLGPVGLVAGAFVRGGAVTVPEGTVVRGTTAAPTPVVIPLEVVPLDPGTRLALKFTTQIDSATAAPGDVVGLAVVGDVIVNHYVIIASGAPAAGMVLRVTRPGPYGTNAAVVIGALAARATDGQAVPLENVVISRGHISTSEIAAAVAEAAGDYVLGQVGTLAGALVHGGEVRAPCGTIVVDDTAAPAIVRIPDVSP